MSNRPGGVDRLNVEEELRFVDQAYAQDGRTELMLQTGARSSELVQLKVEDVSLAERVITIRFCRADDELRNVLRPRSRHHQHVPADRRRLQFRRRTMTVLGLLEVA